MKLEHIQNEAMLVKLEFILIQAMQMKIEHIQNEAMWVKLGCSGVTHVVHMHYLLALATCRKTQSTA